MGLSYHYEFTAPAHVAAAELEEFLLGVESFAQSLGFNPTLVLNAVFDTPERREFSKCLGGSIRFQDQRLEGIIQPAEGQIRNWIPATGECSLTPKRGVVLIITDELGRETCFGFHQFPKEIRDHQGQAIAATGRGNGWVFRDFVDSPDPRYRAIVARFAQAGFVKHSLDEFA